MTATKVIGESVKQTNRTFIKSYVEDYAKAITENYRRYHLNTLNGNLHGNYPEYAKQQLAEIENGTANLMKFVVKTGKRYYKICLLYTSPSPRDYAASRMPSSA